MISIIETQKMTGLSVVSACSLGLTRSSVVSLRATGLSGVSAVSPLSFASLPVVRERNERPIEAPAAAAVAKDAQAQAYAFAAAAAGAKTQTQHHTMWAFRGPEPWSDPA